MKPTQPYTALDDNGKPIVLNEGSIASYTVQPDFDTLHQAQFVAYMLNDARKAGYEEARKHLRDWING